MRVLAEMREIARAHLAQTAVTNLPASLMPAFLPTALVRPLLKSLERDADPFVAHPLPAWRRQWLLWRAARDRRRII
jgi:phytoene synthase